MRAVNHSLFTTRLSVLITGLLLSTFAFSETSLWKVTRDGSTVFLGGTIHMLRTSDFPLPTAFETAFKQSQSLYFETDISGLGSAEAQAQLMSLALAPEGEKITQVLSPQTHEKLSDALEKRGLAISLVEQYRTGVIILTLQTTELMSLGLAAEGVDTFFYKRARQQGLSIGTLESIESQLQYLANMGRGWEDKFVQLSLQELDETARLIDDVTHAWKKGDVDTMNNLFIQEMKNNFPRAYQELLVQRNQHWLPQIEAMFSQPGTEFVLVGAAHMVGTDGLLKQLRQRGYNVKQL